MPDEVVDADAGASRRRNVQSEDRLLSISNNRVVATFEDCRFKRTYLHQHKPLGDVSYHQTVVPSRVPLSRRRRQNPRRRRFPHRAKTGDGSAQMLEAAIYRASYEIARKTSRGTGVVSDRFAAG